MKTYISQRGIAPIAIIIIAAVFFGGLYMSGAFTGSTSSRDGIDVSKTACEDISAARLAVATELGERKAKAQADFDVAKEKMADDYYAKNQEIEASYHACISAALTADPCKEAFEKISSLYVEIMADFDAGKGFNEVKFNAREQAKIEYNNCVEQTHKPDFYKEKSDKCDADMAAAKQANLDVRLAAEASAKVAMEAAIAQAEQSHNEKQATLDAIEKKCNEPGESKKMRVGPLTTEGSGAAVKPNSSACTGVFAGNDDKIARQIAQLEAQLQKAKAGGQSGGLFGTDHLQQALDELRQELAETPRTCKVDADCGDTTPVCCSGSEVGQAYCDAGVCASKKTKCVDPEICAGKPAMCVAPYMGATQQDGVYITRTIPEVGTCSQNLQTLTLEQATEESVRYSISGNIPSWLKINKPSGTLPGSVDVSYSCNTVQKMGPGTYTVDASITVTNAANELINTIPFNVSITVTPAPVEMIEAIEYNGKFLPVSQLHIMSHSGCDNADHWHAEGVVTATDGTKVSDPGPDCGFGKKSQRPVKKVPSRIQVDIETKAELKINGEVHGLELLKVQ